MTTLETILSDPALSDSRKESLRIAAEAGADDATLKTIATAARLARSATIVLPAGRFAHTSRAKGWCRLGSGEGATWGEKTDKGYRVGTPGSWVVYSSDGFNREERVTWYVTQIRVGDAVWTLAD